MKKLISVFAALALVGSLAAQKGKKAPAKPAAPVVAAPKAPAMPAAVTAAPAMAGAMKSMGLTIGFGVGYETNLMNQGTGLSAMGAIAGGGGLADMASRASSTGVCSASGLVAGATTCSGSGTGSATALGGIPLVLTVSYDIVGPIFLRSGFGYTFGLKNTYDLSITGSNAAGDTMTRKIGYTTNASMMEIPILLGFNVVKTEKSTVYVAGGVQYNIATLNQDLTASDVGTGAFTSITYESVSREVKAKGIGVHFIVGGRVKVTDSISLFGEIKWLKSADSAASISGTTVEAGKTYASSNNLLTTVLPSSARTTMDIGGTMITPLRGTTTGTSGGANPTQSANVTTSNMSYDARLIFGVNYEM